MAKANGEYVKVYLYLLRLLHAPNAQLSISHLADFFDHTEKDIRRALKYWEKENLLRLDYDENQEISNICFLAPEDLNALRSNLTQAPVPVVSKQEALDATSASPKKTISKHDYSPNEIAALQSNAEVKELLFVAETYFNKPLTMTDCQTLLFLYDQVGLSASLIEYLLEYCVSKGHTSIRYIEKTGLAWKEQGYESVAEAKANNKAYTKSHNAVMKAFGIKGRNLVESELKTIDHWQRDFGFNCELISEACNRTMSTIHSPSFEYVEKILSSWYKQKVTKLTDLVSIDAKHESKAKEVLSNTKTPRAQANQSGFANFNQRSYNYDQLEQQLLHTAQR